MTWEILLPSMLVLLIGGNVWFLKNWMRDNRSDRSKMFEKLENLTTKDECRNNRNEEKEDFKALCKKNSEMHEAMDNLFKTHEHDPETKKVIVRYER